MQPTVEKKERLQKSQIMFSNILRSYSPISDYQERRRVNRLNNCLTKFTDDVGKYQILKKRNTLSQKHTPDICYPKKLTQSEVKLPQIKQEPNSYSQIFNGLQKEETQNIFPTQEQVDQTKFDNENQENEPPKKRSVWKQEDQNVTLLEKVNTLMSELQYVQQMFTENNNHEMLRQKSIGDANVPPKQFPAKIETQTSEIPTQQDLLKENENILQEKEILEKKYKKLIALYTVSLQGQQQLKKYFKKVLVFKEFQSFVHHNMEVEILKVIDSNLNNNTVFQLVQITEESCKQLDVQVNIALLQQQTQDVDQVKEAYDSYHKVNDGDMIVIIL